LPLLLTILEVHGFAVYEQDGVIVVYPDANARHRAPFVESPNNPRALDSEMIASIVPVKNVRAVYLVPVLRPLMPQNAQLTAVVDRNALIIVDRAANVRRLIAIAQALDRLPEVKLSDMALPETKGE